MESIHLDDCLHILEFVANFVFVYQLKDHLYVIFDHIQMRIFYNKNSFYLVLYFDYIRIEVFVPHNHNYRR